MISAEFIVEPYLSGVRVDTFLSRHLRNYTSWRLHRMVVAGATVIDDVPASGQDRVFRGQRVQIRLIEPPDKLLETCSGRLNVVYEDPWIAVVDKPAGMVAHPVGDFHDGTVCNVLQAHFDAQTAVRGLLRPGVVHRLDRMTSGLLVTAKEHTAHRLLSIDFQQGKLSKTYTALLEGVVPFQERMIDLSIGQRRGKNSVLMSAAGDARNPRPARTRLTLKKTVEDHSLVMCRLFTGRNHQIRVHCAHIGFPVAGDEYYGPHGQVRRSPRFAGESPGTQRHALHASGLGFLHPILREWVEFKSDPPADFYECASVCLGEFGDT